MGSKRIKEIPGNHFSFSVFEIIDNNKTLWIENKEKYINKLL